MKRIRVVGDGTHDGTKVLVLSEDGETASDITEECRSLQITQNAGGIPMLTLVINAPQIDIVGEMRNADDPKPSSPELIEQPHPLAGIMRRI